MVERWFEPFCSCSCEEGIKMCKIITILNEVLSEVSANCEGEEDFIKEKLEESSSSRGFFFSCFNIFLTKVCFFSVCLPLALKKVVCYAIKGSTRLHI